MKQITMAAARKNVNLTQDEMAKKLNVSAATYKAWEAYKRKMPADKLRAFCQITGWSMDFIFLDEV